MNIIKIADVTDDDRVIVMRCTISKKTGNATFTIIGQDLGEEGCLKVDADGNPINEGIIRYWAGVCGIDVSEILDTAEGRRAEEGETNTLPSAFEEAPAAPSGGDDDDDDFLGNLGKKKDLDLGFGV